MASQALTSLQIGSKFITLRADGKNAISSIKEAAMADRPIFKILATEKSWDTSAVPENQIETRHRPLIAKTDRLGI